MGLTAAVIGAGALGVAGSVGSSMIGANAAQSASQQQAQSAQSALALQKSMFGTAQTALNPYINAGQGALSTLTGLETPGSSAATLSTMPGFQFQSQYGNLAATNQLTAQGLGGSAGPLGSALSQYNQGLAGTYYMNSINALQNTANMGAGSASALGGQAANFGNMMGQTTQNIGNAQAAGTLGSANALSGGLTGAASSAGNALLMSQLFGAGSGGGSLYANGGGNYLGMSNSSQDALQDSGFALP